MPVNSFNFANFDSAASILTPQLNGGAGSINGTGSNSRESAPRSYRGQLFGIHDSAFNRVHLAIGETATLIDTRSS